MSFLRIVCTIFFFALTLSCAAQADLFPATVMKKERVKEVLVAERYAVKNGIIKAGTDSTLYRFNAEGRMSSMSVFHADSAQNMKVIYEYDSTGLKKEQHYLPPSKPHKSIVYEYGNDKMLDSAVTWFNGAISNVTVYTYDTVHHKTIEVSRSANYKSRLEKEYTRSGKLLNMVSFSEKNDSLVRGWETTYTYDQAGHCTAVLSKLSAMTVIERLSYKGDLLYRRKSEMKNKNYGWEEYIYQKR